MAGKKATPATGEELPEEPEGEGWDEQAGGEAGQKGRPPEPGMRLRDWRDVEKYREMRELRRLVDDDFGLNEIARRARSDDAELRRHKPAPKAADKVKGGRKR